MDGLEPRMTCTRLTGAEEHEETSRKACRPLDVMDGLEPRMTKRKPTENGGAVTDRRAERPQQIVGFQLVRDRVRNTRARTLYHTLPTVTKVLSSVACYKVPYLE